MKDLLFMKAEENNTTVMIKQVGLCFKNDEYAEVVEYLV